MNDQKELLPCRFCASEEELELLERYKGTVHDLSDPSRYDNFSADSLAMFCRMKDRSNDIFMRRCAAAREVIDIIAEQVGINPNKTSFWLYAPDADGSTPIVKRIEEWVSRSGEKAVLKKRIQELEQENSVLRSLIQK